MSTANFRFKKIQELKSHSALPSSTTHAGGFFVAQLLADVANRINRRNSRLSPRGGACQEARRFKTGGTDWVTHIFQESCHKANDHPNTPPRLLRSHGCHSSTQASSRGLCRSPLPRFSRCCTRPLVVYAWLCTPCVADHLVGRYEETPDLRPLRPFASQADAVPCAGPAYRLQDTQHRGDL